MNRPVSHTTIRPEFRTLREDAAVGPPDWNAASAAAFGITVYGCEPDEADMFAALSPQLGARPTMTAAQAAVASIIAVPGTRCASVGHKAPLGREALRTLRDSGVDYVSTRSIGFDHIDLRAAADMGITVGNIAYAPDGVADFTVMLILMLIRGTREILAAAGRSDFRLPAARGRDLRDVTVGVVGTGRIGTAVIDRLHGFGCRVLAHGNCGDSTGAAEIVPLAELLRRSDVVTLHLPLNAGTRHLMGAVEIAAMRPRALLVNTGRGALVDTAALTSALETGSLAGAALDVLEGEDGFFYCDCRDRAADHPFLHRLQAMPNVIVTPHLAYYTERALHDAVANTILNCRRFIRGGADE